MVTYHLTWPHVIPAKVLFSMGHIKLYTVKKKFSIKDFLQLIRPNLQFPEDLITFIIEILNENLHFLCSENYKWKVYSLKDKLQTI